MLHLTYVVFERYYIIKIPLKIYFIYTWICSLVLLVFEPDPPDHIKVWASSGLHSKPAVTLKNMRTRKICCYSDCFGI